MKRILVGFLLVAVLAAGCGAGRRKQEQPVYVPDELPAPVITQKEPLTVAQQVAAAPDVRKVRITDYGFEPDELRAATGSVVRIHLVNASSGRHNLVIDRFGILSRTLAPGEENYLEFTAGAAGAWPMLSDAPGAPEPAFSGTLKVE